MYKPLHPLIKITCLVFLILVVFVILIVGRDFLYPIFLAILFAYLLYPLVNLLEKWKFPRVVAILLSLLLAIVLIGGALFLLYQQMSVFIADFPGLRDQALSNLNELQRSIDNVIGNSSSEKWWLKDRVAGLINNSGDMINKVFTATTGTVVKLGLQPVFVFFMLYYRERIKRFIRMVWKDEERRESILYEISDVTQNYIGGVFIVVVILCFLNSIGLMIIGIKYAVMFGIISAIMNFIPYFGTLIGAAFPLAYTLVSDDPNDAIGVMILFMIIQFTENNILTPSITGGRVAINPLFTILIIIAGGLVWGVPGMFMSIPYIGMLKVVCSHYRSLKPLAFLISKNKGGGISKGWKLLKNYFD